MGFLDYVRASNRQAPEARGSLIQDWPWSAAPPTESSLFAYVASPEVAAGLPAWLAVIRRLAQGAAMCPLEVYRGPREKRERADDAPVAGLLRKPGDEYPSGYAFRADVAASFAARGEAFIRKYRAGGRVAALLVLDPLRVKVEYRDGRVVYLDSTAPRMVDGVMSPTVRTSREVIHIRDFAFSGGLHAHNPIASLRNQLSGGQRRQSFTATYFENAARPDVVLRFPQGLGRTQVREFLAEWNARYQGPQNAGRAAALGGGAEIETLPPVSLEDAQYVESEMLTLDTIAGLYGVPAAMVGRQGSVSEEDRLNFVTFGLGPIFTAVETALSADPDLFPPTDREPLFCEHDADRLLRATTQARYDAHAKARQGGWKSLNEIRAEENLPPVDGGDTVQLTPVGGPVDRTGGPGDTEPDDTTEVPA